MGLIVKLILIILIGLQGFHYDKIILIKLSHPILRGDWQKLYYKYFFGRVNTFVGKFGNFIDTNKNIEIDYMRKICLLKYQQHILMCD